METQESLHRHLTSTHISAITYGIEPNAHAKLIEAMERMLRDASDDDEKLGCDPLVVFTLHYTYTTLHLHYTYTHPTQASPKYMSMNSI